MIFTSQSCIPCSATLGKQVMSRTRAVPYSALSALECWALIGHLSEWQFDWLSNKFVNFSNGGARNSPNCKTIINVQKVSRQMAKEAGVERNIFCAEMYSPWWKQEVANAGMFTVVRSLNRAMKLITSWKRG